MQTLTRRATEILLDEWQRWEQTPPPKEYPSSKLVYDRLVSERWPVPDYALRELWEQLQALEQIRAALYQANRDRRRTDGLADFVWVNPDILDDTQGLNADTDDWSV